MTDTERLTQLRETQDYLFEQARTIREGGEEVMPCAFVIDARGGVNVISLVGAPKEFWAAGIREVKRAVGGVAVIIHSEGYMATGENAMLAAHLKLQGVDTIQGLPGVGEFVYSTMETAEGTSRVLRAEVTGEAKDKAPLGETLAEEHNTPAEGEMAGFFK